MPVVEDVTDKDAVSVLEGVDVELRVDVRVGELDKDDVCDKLGVFDVLGVSV